MKDHAAIKAAIDAATEFLGETIEQTIVDDTVQMPKGFAMTEQGLTWADDADEILACGKFEVVAETRDGDGTSWGLLLRWDDNDGREHQLALPRAALAGDGAEARRILLDGGLYVAPSRKARDRLNNFLLAVKASSSRSRATSRIGWHDNVFVLPGATIGLAGMERFVLQGGIGSEHAFHVGGCIDEWNQHVAGYATGNSRIMLAISAAFAAALLRPCNAESGGLHFQGASSIGKTTVLVVAGSVWGGGETGFVRTWRATANGVEGVAMAHCDALLCLDEMSQLSSREAGEVAYMLANGAGKSRATRTGAPRRSAHWRVLFLSSGEIGLADKVAENGGRRRLTAGQQVRIVDVSADADAGLGIFEDLHKFPTADALARHLRQAALTYYGAAARMFVERIAPDKEDVCEAVAAHVRSFVDKHVPAAADGQVQRVAQRFGLIAAAGELAVTGGVITSWEEGQATAASARCFEDWLAERGSVEPSEVRDGLEQKCDPLSAHGEARFVPAWEKGKEDRLPLRDIVGYRKQTDGTTDFYVTAAAWRDEVCRGYDPKALAAAMVARGLIQPGDGDHRAKSIQVPGVGRRRLYHVLARFLEAEHD